MSKKKRAEKVKGESVKVREPERERGDGHAGCGIDEYRAARTSAHLPKLNVFVSLSAVRECSVHKARVRVKKERKAGGEVAGGGGRKVRGGRHAYVVIRAGLAQ